MSRPVLVLGLAIIAGLVLTVRDALSGACMRWVQGGDVCTPMWQLDVALLVLLVALWWGIYRR